ncbi:MAG: pilus assembly protein TadG-related protein [Gammaproteobacteria bacterium]
MRFPKKQKGQAIPIGIAAILGVTILMLTLFNTSQVVSEKMRIVNTADAAAYSGMVVQARTMNFTAYTNRAMVANQVALAQMVSLASFGTYVEQVGIKLSMALAAVPFIGPAISRGVNVAAKTARALISAYAQVSAGVIHLIQVSISKAQKAANVASVAATKVVVNAVVAANDPNYEVTFVTGNALMAINKGSWIKATKQYTNNLYQTRKANLAMASRDGFSTRKRGWRRKLYLDISIGGTGLFGYIYRDADTRLFSKRGQNKNSRTQKNLKWEWKAKDTLSVWAGYKWNFLFDSGSSEKEVPVGYGSAFMSETNRDFDPTRWRWRRWNFKNRSAERTAGFKSYTTNMSTGYGGMQPYYDLADTGTGSKVVAKKRPTVALGIEVTKKANPPIRTSSNIKDLGSTKAYVKGSTRNGMGATGLFRVDDNFAANKGVSAVARAELYFSRPVGVGKSFGSNRRTNDIEEYANLFNPYWDVRLADPTTERKAALGVRALSKLF